MAALTKAEESEEATEETPKTIKVKISRKVSDNTNGQGAYTDPGSKASIGAEAAEVPNTPFVQALLMTGEIVKG